MTAVFVSSIGVGRTRNDVVTFRFNLKLQIRVRILAAGGARGLRFVVPRKKREQGMPDARCTRGPVCKNG
jgi:hypothetical protein